MTSSKIKADATPQVLQWARESLGLSEEDVASRLRRRSETIRQWESGSDAPLLSELERLASLYKRPLAVFFLPAPPPEPPAPKDFRKLPAGTKQRFSVKTRLALRKAQWLQSIASRLIRDLDLPSARLGKAF